MNILIINGPNLNLLGIREPDVYGSESYDALCRCIREACRQEEVECDIMQSNHEGAIVDAIQAAYGVCDGIVINPAAYTHTSVAILDALKAVCIPTVEVHLSDIRTREDFRRYSYISPACIATICGKGFAGYQEAIRILKYHLEKQQEKARR